MAETQSVNGSRIRPGEIQVGKPLPWSVMDESGILLLRKGHVITSQRQIDILVARGVYAVSSAAAPVAAAPSAPPSPFQLFDNFQLRLKRVCEDIISGNLGENGQARVNQLCGDMQKLCQYDGEAVLGATHLCHEGRYTVIHALHSAIICEIFLRSLGTPAHERIPILAAALTHDVGMMELHDVLHKQNTPLTDEQISKVKSHPQLGVEMLKKAGVTDEIWLDTVLHHHERLDGSGYPKGLHDADIPFPVRVLSIVDIYCALLKPRAYRSGLGAKEALREMFLKRAGHVDERLTQTFIKEMGLFPPGAFVRLQNGDIAVITRRDKTKASLIAHSVIGPRGAPLERPVKRDTNLPDFKIQEMVTHDSRLKLNLNLHTLWGYAA